MSLMGTELRYPKLSTQRWTTEQGARLLELWTADYSCSEISRRINVEFGTTYTRNAVIGRVHRENFPNRKQRVNQNGYARRPKEPRAPRTYKAVYVAKAKLPTPDIIDQQIPFTQRKQLIDLGPLDCRWPVGDVGDPGFFFCGATTNDRPYCDGHHARGHQCR